MVELDVSVEPFALGHPPRDHELATRVDVGLQPAIPGDQGEQGEDRERQCGGERLQLRLPQRLRPSACAILILLGYLPCRKRWRAAIRSLRALGSATSRLWFPAALASARNFPRPLMHGGGKLLAAVYYRARPKYLRAARANLSIIRGLSRGRSGGPRTGLGDGRLALRGVGRLPALRDAASRGRRAARRGRHRLLAHRRGASAGQGRPAADGAPGQLGGRRADARADEAADPRGARAGHLPGRRASAPAPARSLRRRRDPRRPEFHSDARRPARAVPERDRGHAGRPGLRQHGRGDAVSSGGRPTSRADRSASRWPPARPSFRPSSCECPTAATGRSWKSRFSSSPARIGISPCAATSSATSPFSSATSGSTPTSGTASSRSGTIPRAKGESAVPSRRSPGGAAVGNPAPYPTEDA